MVRGALGDALGKPTQGLSPDEYRPMDLLTVLSSPRQTISFAELAAGSITDDTEQTLLLGRVLRDSGPAFDHRRWIQALLDGERGVKARGCYDLLGPSTKRAIDAINGDVDPKQAGRNGDTYGAAMRIAPVGVIMPPEPLDALVVKVAETCRARTTPPSRSSPRLPLLARSFCGVSGADWPDAADHATEAARRGVGHGPRAHARS